MASARPVLETAEIGRILTRIAHEVLERNHGPEDLVLLGIPSRGVPLAQRPFRSAAAKLEVDEKWLNRQKFFIGNVLAAFAASSAQVAE